MPKIEPKVSEFKDKKGKVIAKGFDVESDEGVDVGIVISKVEDEGPLCLCLREKWYVVIEGEWEVRTLDPDRTKEIMEQGIDKMSKQIMAWNKPRAEKLGPNDFFIVPPNQIHQIYGKGKLVIIYSPGKNIMEEYGTSLFKD